MAVSIEDGLRDRIEENTGGAGVQLRGASDPAAARAGMAAAQEALNQIPHPEEPDDPLPSYVSDLTEAEGGPAFWFDVADAEAYPGLVDRIVAAIVEALDSAGADGVLVSWSPR